MAKPIIRIHNAQTDEIIDREMTDDEFKAWNDGNKAKAAKDAAEAQAKSSAEAKLEALGLSVADLKAIGF